MHILVLVPSLVDLVGGIQTYSQALVWALSRIGESLQWKIEVVGLHDRADAATARPNLPHVRLTGCGGSKAWFAWASLRHARDADLIVMTHVNFAPLVHALRFMAPRARYRISVHGIDVWRRLAPVVAWGVRRAGGIWNVSEYSRQRMLQENPSLAGVNFAYLPNTLGPAYPPALAARSRQQLGLKESKVLLSVSRLSALEPYKNTEALLRAMPEVVRTIPEVQLVVAGPGDDQPRLQQIAAQLGIADRVRFTGRIPDEELQSYFAACDLFVLPSTGEGFGIVYLEAMYHGKACIGARAGGVPEVIEDGVTGVLVEPDGLSRLSEVITELLRDDARRAAMGAAGRARLDSEFSLERFQDRLRSLLRA